MTHKNSDFSGINHFYSEKYSVNNISIHRIQRNVNTKTDVGRNLQHTPTGEPQMVRPSFVYSCIYFTNTFLPLMM